MRFKGYPETTKRAAVALESAKRKHGYRLLSIAKERLLRWQYNGTRAFFAKRPNAVGVAWNGLNGTRRVFMDAARDAGARTLYFELCPFPGRVTVDPCGVNFHNGLPRTAAPYAAWASARPPSSAWRKVRDDFRARKSSSPAVTGTPDLPLSDPFIFVPLQVPGDSQLRLFGGAFRTVEAVIRAVAAAARHLPDGWHLRLKEHPSSPTSFRELIADVGHPKLALDNATDTFVQVAASRGVVTVNSSVGLEAMFFDKPVIALGDCFWAIPGIAEHCPTQGELAKRLSEPDHPGFDRDLRRDFLNFLVEEYYPDLQSDQAGGALAKDEAAKVLGRLSGPNELGFWSCKGAA